MPWRSDYPGVSSPPNSAHGSLQGGAGGAGLGAGPATTPSDQEVHILSEKLHFLMNDPKTITPIGFHFIVKFLSGDAKPQNKFWGDWTQIFYPSHFPIYVLDIPSNTKVGLLVLRQTDNDRECNR